MDVPHQSALLQFVLLLPGETASPTNDQILHCEESTHAVCPQPLAEAQDEMACPDDRFGRLACYLPCRWVSRSAYRLAGLRSGKLASHPSGTRACNRD